MIHGDIKGYTIVVLLMSILTLVTGCSVCGSYRAEIDKQIEDLDVLRNATVKEAEEQSYAAIKKAVASLNSDIPDAAFGLRQQNWEAFKEKIAPGDCLLFFNTTPESWKRLRGRKGYIIVRDGKVIDAFITMVN